jgi:hypothetical protein
MSRIPIPYGRGGSMRTTRWRISRTARRGDGQMRKMAQMASLAVATAGIVALGTTPSYAGESFWTFTRGGDCWDGEGGCAEFSHKTSAGEERVYVVDGDTSEAFGIRNRAKALLYVNGTFRGSVSDGNDDGGNNRYFDIPEDENVRVKVCMVYADNPSNYIDGTCNSDTGTS